MSAIFGIFYRDARPVDSADLALMSESMAHRGPDSLGIWCNGPLGLGQRMLQSTPESLHEKLPFEEKESGLVITADARIDNREELGEALGVKRLAREGIPDSHLILLAYKKWGLECPEHLLGDFSFAIWDKQQRQLFCAVDAFSIRPFCYYNSQQRFIFASDITGLLPGYLAPKVINEVRVASQFMDLIGEVNPPGTLYKDIYYLPSAHCLIADHRGIKTWKYWNPEDIAEVKLADDAEYVEKFTALLKESVRCRLRSNSDTALALSGGIDSATIAAHSLDLLAGTGKRQVTFSGISSDKDDCLESNYIRQGLPALSQHPVTFTPEVVKTMQPRLLEVMSEYHYPLGINSLFLLSLYHHASQHGHKVMLHGCGGDTTLGLGPSYIAYLMRMGKIPTAIKEGALLSKNTFNSEISPYTIFRVNMMQAMMPRYLHQRLFSLKLKLSSYRFNNNALFNQSLTERIGLKSLIMQAREHQGFGLEHSLSQLHIQLFQRPFMWRVNYGLDMLSSPFSLELRSPYDDKRLIEFSLGLPWNQKNRDGWEKWILRKSSHPAIPPAIRWRRKRDHVGWQFLDAFMGLIEDELADIINDKHSMVFNYLDYHLVQSAYHRYRSGQRNQHINDMAAIYGVETWLKNHAA